VTTVVRTSTGEEYTAALAGAAAALLRPGDVVTLEGELGAGKTTFVRSLAIALGVDAAVISSPTYVFVNVYPAGRCGVGRVVHVDCYRLTSADDLEPLGWDRLFDPQTRAALGGVAVVEWASRIPDASMLPAPGEMLRLVIEPVSVHERRFALSFPESWRTREGFAWFVEREPTRCPTTGAWVSPLSETYPFADARARGADLYKWFSGQYTASRPIRPEDAEDAV
jgi:tRNA threonylcarbamoyl adenosine modification protein YjeE